MEDVIVDEADLPAADVEAARGRATSTGGPDERGEEAVDEPDDLVEVHLGGIEDESRDTGWYRRGKLRWCCAVFVVVCVIPRQSTPTKDLLKTSRFQCLFRGRCLP